MFAGGQRGDGFLHGSGNSRLEIKVVSEDGGIDSESFSGSDGVV